MFAHLSVQLQIFLSMCLLYYLSNTDPPEPLHLQLLSYVTELFLSPGWRPVDKLYCWRNNMNSVVPNNLQPFMKTGKSRIRLNMN